MSTGNLKRIVEQQCGIHQKMLRLICNQRELFPGMNLDDQNVSERYA
jgi:hypothetical protein